MKHKFYGTLAIIFACTNSVSYAAFCSPQFIASYYSSPHPTSIAFSSSGDYFATCGISSNQVTRFKLADIVGPNGRLQSRSWHSLPSGSSKPTSIAISPNGAFMATANWESDNITMFVPNFLTGGFLAVPHSLYTNSNGPQSIGFSPDGTHLVVANNKSKDLNIFTVSLKGQLSNPADYNLPGNPILAIYSPNGKYLAVGLLDGVKYSVRLYHIDNNGILTGNFDSLLSSSGIDSMAFSPDPDNLYLAIATTNSITIFDTTGGTLNNSKSYPIPSDTYYPGGISFTPDGSQIAVTSPYTDNIILFPVTNGIVGAGVPYLVPYKRSGPRKLVFSPNGSYLITVNYDSDDVSLFEITCQL